MDLRVAAYAVVERRGKILLTHWRRGHLHGWTLPGGGLEAGEDPRDAVVREVLEETGLEAKVGKLLGVDSRVMVREEVPEGTDPELHTIRIVYRATVKDGPLQHEVDGSSDEARWVPIRELGKLRTLSLVQTALRMAGIGRRPTNGSGKGQAKSGAKQAKAAPAKTGQARSGQGKAAAGKTSPSKAGQSRSTPSKSGQRKSGGKPPQNRGGRGRGGQSGQQSPADTAPSAPAE
ncbi:NUDIX hydrolase [Leucobacter chromiireducens]|uniref:NUDIX hydrolase n=1 Tax=Leucobacter chromiireducens TaxID=283877 RepID=UPI003F810970